MRVSADEGVSSLRGTEATAKDVFEAARAGDALAQRVVDEVGGVGSPAARLGGWGARHGDAELGSRWNVPLELSDVPFSHRCRPPSILASAASISAGCWIPRCADSLEEHPDSSLLCTFIA